ncbi:MAG TPA: hypothetical protein VJ775_04635, partial [Sphingomicrobium sp.]|nr:hypothetical protein [Sphingomicrobium sp.]
YSWDDSNYWSAARLLVASGHGDELVRVYDRSKPLVRSGELSIDAVAIPEVVLALRQAGRRTEADTLLRVFKDNTDRLPTAGLGGALRETNLAIVAALSGRDSEAVDRVEELSRRHPDVLASVPAMSLLNSPFFGRLKADPRILESDARLRNYVNSERAKAGMPPIGREDWISDPKTLLTKN